MSQIDGDDGLPADEVGVWVKEKHTYLKRYLDISRATRKKYIGDRKAGQFTSTYFVEPAGPEYGDNDGLMAVA